MTNILTTWSKVHEQIAKIFPPYMESEAPLPYLRDHVSGPYPDSWIQSTTCFPPALRSDFIFRYSRRSSSLRVSHYNSVRIYLLSHACHVARLSCRRRSYDFKNVWLKVQIMKLLVPQFSLASLYFLLDPDIFLQDSVLAHSHCMFCFPIWDQVSHPYKITIQL